MKLFLHHPTITTFGIGAPLCLTFALACGGGGAKKAPTPAVQEGSSLAIRSVRPTPARAGEEILLEGVDLAATTKVLVGGVEAAHHLRPDGSMQVVVPLGSGAGGIQVESAGRPVASAPLAVDAGPPRPAHLPRAWAPPTLLRIEPNIQRAGGQIVLHGTNLDKVTEVAFHGGHRAAVAPGSDAAVASPQVTVPAGAGTGPVTLLGPGHQVLTTISFTLTGQAAPPSDTAAAMRQSAETAASSNAAMGPAFTAARHRLRMALAQNHRCTGRFGNILDLTAEYNHAHPVITAAAARPVAATEYKINYEVISSDPFLHLHNVDIDTLVPRPVTDQEYRTMMNALVATGHLTRLTEQVIGANLDTANPVTKAVVRKKLKRIYDEILVRQAVGTPTDIPGLSQVAFFANEMELQGGRCPDGIQNGVNAIEARVFPGAGSPEPRNIGEFISSVLTDYKMAFIRKHADILPADPEFPTMVVQTLSQSMLHSMGLRGGFVPLTYPYLGLVADPQFSSRAVMRRFLEGERGVTVGHFHGAVPTHFEAFTVDKMCGLLEAAWERRFAVRGLRPSRSGTLTSELPDAVLQAELVDPADYTPREPMVGQKFADFQLSGFEPNEYFLGNRAENNASDYRMTPAFWKHFLRKYWYIVPVA
jgi:hypothetical protein